MSFKDYRTESKKNWGSESALSRDDLMFGCMLRISDAAEKIVDNYNSLQNTLIWYKEGYNEKSNEIAQLNRKIRAYKASITRLKKRK